MAKTSPTQRTLAKLRKDGYQAGVVEKWIPQTKRRLDLFGAIDIVAVGHGHILGVQCTTASNQSSRIAKMRDEPRLTVWMENGGRLQCWGWSKKGPRGKRKTWQVSVTELTPSAKE